MRTWGDKSADLVHKIFDVKKGIFERKKLRNGIFGSSHDGNHYFRPAQQSSEKKIPKKASTLE